MDPHIPEGVAKILAKGEPETPADRATRLVLEAKEAELLLRARAAGGEEVRPVNSPTETHADRATRLAAEAAEARLMRLSEAAGVSTAHTGQSR